MDSVASGLLIGVRAGLLAVPLARGGGRRRRFATGCLSLLAVLVLVGCRPAAKATVVATAPVDAALSLYAFTPPSPCGDCIPTSALAAYSARDGSTRWTYAPPAPGFLPGVPVFHAGMLFGFTWQEGDAQHSTLTAVRASDGKPLWHARVQGFPPPIAQAGDYVVLEIRSATAAVPPYLLVLRAADGTQLHQIPLTSSGTLVADGDGAYICSDDGLLSAFRLSDGRPIWKIAVLPGAPTTTYEGTCTPEAAGGTLYYLAPSIFQFAPIPAGLVAARESDGHTLWRQPVLRALPIVRDGMLLGLVPSTRHTGGTYDMDLAAFRASDGALLWRIAGSPIIISLPIVKAGPAVVYERGPALVAVRATDGAPIWQRQLPDRYLTLAGATDGEVVAYSSGHWTIRHPAPPNVDTSDYLVALRPSDGSTFWQIPAGPSGFTVGAAP